MKYQLLLLVAEPDAALMNLQHPNVSLTIVSDVETALEKLHLMDFDAIMYTDFLPLMQENKLQKISELIQEGIMLARKESYESWDFCIEKVQDALKDLRMRKIRITDDALKNAHFNICLN